MSYGVSAALQTAVYQHLAADAGVVALVGADIYDKVPVGAVPATYVALGPEIVTDQSDKSGDGALHEFTISVVTELEGFSSAKAVAVAVNDALNDASLSLARGRLVYLHFERAEAKRTEGAASRRIDLRFAARVEDN